MTEKKELVGFDLAEKSLKLEDEALVGEAKAVHVGKIGSLEISIKGKVEFLPFLDKAIDKLEEVIPGDQKQIANTLKTVIRSIKIKL
jgi:hypothetical protein